MVKHLYTYPLTHMYIHTPLTNYVIKPCSLAANYALFLDGVTILLVPLLSSCTFCLSFWGVGEGACVMDSVRGHHTNPVTGSVSDGSYCCLTELPIDLGFSLHCLPNNSPNVETPS